MYWDGAFRFDLRMQMGCASAKHTGKRTSLLPLHLLREAIRDDGAVPAIIDTDQNLRGWCKEHGLLFPNNEDQWMACHIMVYQDDLTLLAAGEDIGREILCVFRAKLPELDVTLSAKREPTGSS